MVLHVGFYGLNWWLLQHYIGNKCPHFTRSFHIFLHVDQFRIKKLFTKELKPTNFLFSMKSRGQKPTNYSPRDETTEFCIYHEIWRSETPDFIIYHETQRSKSLWFIYTSIQGQSNCVFPYGPQIYDDLTVFFPKVHKFGAI